MTKVINVIGARPQIIKASAISRAIKTKYFGEIAEIVLHTGQHYDDRMSQVFFDEMDIPQPHYNLHAGSSSHGKQTALIIEKLEEVLLFEKPDFLILYGDTNSTLAGAVAASKIHIPIVHIEAGLRSFNKSMPEEINRIVCDHCSTLLFTPTRTGFNNLISEGFKPNPMPPFSVDNPAVFHCGDVMYDNTLYFSAIANSRLSYLEEHGLESCNFILATIHRDNNTDQISRFQSIIDALIEICIEYDETIVLPAHPRTLRIIETQLPDKTQRKLKSCNRLKIVPPASFFEMIILERESKMVITDSGGVQKEAFFFKKPCLILRKETEWKEITDCAAALLTDANKPQILASYKRYSENPPETFPAIFGDGHAAEFICQTILQASKQ